MIATTGGAGRAATRPGAVVVVGSINVDLTVAASPLPRPGETLTGSSFASGLGGKGANQAVAAARAGATTSMVGAVGRDTFGTLALDALRADGVDVDWVEEVDGPTGVAHIRVDARTGENSIVIVPEANGALTPARVEESLRELAPSSPVVLLQLETPLEVALATARACSELGLKLVLDPAPAAPLPDEIWEGVWLACPNETEAELLTGTRVTDVRSAERAARWFSERGVRQVVVTRGGRGTVVVGPGGTSDIPAFGVTPVDTTAAGDTFAGALGAAVAAGLAWPVALRRAAAAGALATTKPGATSSIPTAAEVDAYLKGR
ncbi:ribokinase [Microlunatus flavus]|uniref:Ribokinase n=1 Tax=Microlunatus flavus TaxID=1036181 RepID=A0A1H9K5J4_9ACTN|nr:ribokinase [Microlunatus flavus]SEQ94308.1 ribokinase [Microlunatus flavus]